MDKIVFSWSEYLRRDVSLFEEVEFAPIRVLLKYIYPDDLVGRLPPACRPICESLAEKLQTLHVNLYSEEAIQELYHKDSVSLKTKKITKFIDDSLRRLLESNEHPSHVLFKEETIPALVEFFVDLIKTPATTVITPDLTPLRRPADSVWIQASSEIEGCQSRFLFHYFVSYLRKLVECRDVDGVFKLRIRSKDDVISSFSKGNAEDLFSPLVTSPKVTDFEINNERCLVLQSAVSLPQKVITEIFGDRIFSALDSQSSTLVLEMTATFIKKHRKICCEMHPMVDSVKILERLSTTTLSRAFCKLGNKLSAAIYLSFPGLYTRFNLEAAYRHFVSNLPLKNGMRRDDFFEITAIELNPEPLPFIEDLGSHLRPTLQIRLADYQQALFYNSMYFYYHYMTHWFRRIASVVRSKDNGGFRYSLHWRSKEEIEILLEKSAFWAKNSEAVLEELRRIYPDKFTSNDSAAGGSNTSTATEEVSQFPSTSVFQPEEVPAKGYEATETTLEEEITGETTSKAEEKKRRKVEKSKGTAERENEEPKVDDTEKILKKLKKRKKKERHIGSDDDPTMIEVVSPKESYYSDAGGTHSCTDTEETSQVLPSSVFKQDDLPVKGDNGEESTGGNASKPAKKKKRRKSTDTEDLENEERKEIPSCTPNVDAAQSALTSAPRVGETPVKDSKASEAIDEEELPGGTASKLEKKKKRKRRKSKENEESANEDGKDDDTETVVKKSKKRKKEKRHSESDDDVKIMEVVSPKEKSTVLKRKRKKSCEVVELSSDEEFQLLPDDAWEQKWKSEADHLCKDKDVPALVTLTLQTVLENNRRLRFQLRALGS